MLKYLLPTTIAAGLSSIVTYTGVQDLYTTLYEGKDALPFDSYGASSFCLGTVYIWVALFVPIYYAVYSKEVGQAVMMAAVFLLFHEVFIWPWMQGELVGIPCYTVAIFIVYGFICLFGEDPRAFSQD